MMHAIRQRVIVQEDGLIQIYTPKLKPGMHAEVIILEESEEPPAKVCLSDMLGQGQGGFASAAQIDTFIRKERES